MGRVGKYGRESRAGNIITAVSEVNPAKKKAIENLVNSGDLSLPVSSSAKSLQAKLKVAQEAAGPELEAAKAALDPLPEISVKAPVKKLKASRPIVEGSEATVQPRRPAGFTSETPGPVTTVEKGTGNPQLLNAIDSQISELERLAGPGLKLKPSQVQALKEQLQDAANSAYKVASETGAATPASADAAKSAAAAMREVLETSPEIPEAIRARLAAANKAERALLSVSQPLEARRLADIGKPFISRSIAGLLGRGLSGGGSSALGAAAGVEAGSAFQNVLFNTLSAAGKAKVAPLLESGDIQAAVQAAFAAHIAEQAAKREAP